jgi:hypothetical protein
MQRTGGGVGKVKWKGMGKGTRMATTRARNRVPFGLLGRDGSL